MNIFHAYRGASVSDDARTIQLEDNLTRALMITFWHLRGTSAQAYMTDLLGLDVQGTDGDVQVQMQVGKPSIDWPPPQMRQLLVIHGGPELRIVDNPGVSRSGRVDAVISTRSQLMAIESKIDDAVSRQQLERHKQSLNLSDGLTHQVTWGDVVRTIRSIPDRDRMHPLVNFVLQQCEEYLQMNGYGGLAHEHFAYFAHTPEQRDELVKDGIRRSLGDIGTSIVHTMGTNWTTHVLNVMPDAWGCGVLIRPDSKKKEPHLTIGIDVSGLLIMANIELQHAHSRFMRAWRHDPARLVSILRHLGDQSIKSIADSPWRLRVLRRVPLGPPRKFHYWTAVDVALNSCATWDDQRFQDFVTSVVQKPDQEAAPEITITRSYSIQQVVGSDDIGAQLARDAMELKPFFEWIGEPFIQKQQTP